MSYEKDMVNFVKLKSQTLPFKRTKVYKFPTCKFVAVWCSAVPPVACTMLARVCTDLGYDLGVGVGFEHAARADVR